MGSKLCAPVSSSRPRFDDLIPFRYAIQYRLCKSRFNKIYRDIQLTGVVMQASGYLCGTLHEDAVRKAVVLNPDNSNTAMFDVQSSLVGATRMISSIVLCKARKLYLAFIYDL